MADRKISALTALTSPATGDLVPIVDVSEAANADKNKSITFGTMFRSLPDGSTGAPSVGFLSDSGTGGIYRSAANELAFSINSSFIGKVTSQGFQLGTGTAAAQLHLFSTDTTDQVIIENSDAGLDTAPDLVLFRNSASPAASDNLGNLEFRGEDSAGNTHAYAQLVSQIVSPTNGSESGTLDLMTSASGSVATRIRVKGENVGINETSPDFLLHVTDSTTGTMVEFENTANDPASAADLTLNHHRNGAAGQDNDVISTVFFRSKNDAGTPGNIDYASVEGSIADASSTTEDGKLKLKVQTAGTLTTQLELNSNKIGFFGATAAVQSTHVADITTTATSGTLPTPNGTVTINNAASPTNAELLEYCVELEAKVEALLAFASAHGLMASS